MKKLNQCKSKYIIIHLNVKTIGTEFWPTSSAHNFCHYRLMTIVKTVNTL